MTVNMSLIMVVAASPIDRVVVSGIVKSSGLRAVSCEPDRTQAAIASHERDGGGPCMIIVDPGEDGAVIDHLRQRRKESADGLPRVVLVGGVRGIDMADAADAMITRPITSETLQPVIFRLMTDARG